MAFLFLVVLVLLIWVARLAGRVTELEARDAALTDELLSLRARLDEAGQPAVPHERTHAREQAAEPRREEVGVPPPPIPRAAPVAPRPSQPPPVSASQVAPPAAAPPSPAASALRSDSPAVSSAAAGVHPTAASAAPAPPVAPRAAAPAPAAAPPAPRPAVQQAEPPRKPFDWEELIGVRLFSWVAGIALAVAAVFFLGYSIQQGWLQPPVRMAIGLAVGLGLLFTCELKAARRYPVTANAMDGAAIVILFSTFFAAYRPWHLLGPVSAFALLAAVTVVAVLLSIRRDSVFIALLGLVGGFSTPALLSSGQDNPFGLFGYLLPLNAGLGWVAYRKRWPALVALSLFFTTVYQWGWVAAFLTPNRSPVAASIFLAFPLLGFVLLGVAGRAGTLDTATGTPRATWFEKVAALNGALPLLFALFMAGSPVYGEHPAVLFGFLLCVDAGLFAVALWRRQMLLHALGAVMTLAVFAAWMSRGYVPTGDTGGGSYPSVLAFASLFVLFYLAAGLAGRHGTRRLEGPGRLAVYAAPLILFVFPAVCAFEPAVGAPALAFTVLIGLLGFCAAFAISEQEGPVYFIAAFLSVAAEAAWSAFFLSPERLLPALAVYAALTLVMVVVPLVARRLGKPLQPAMAGGVLLLASIGLLAFLAQDTVASSSLFGLALLLGGLNLALVVEARSPGLRALTIVGGLLSWLVLSLWMSTALVTQVVPGLLVLVAFAFLVVGSQLWLHRDPAQRASDETQASLALALVAHLFLVLVAGQPSLSNPPWPMLAVLALLDLAIGAAALYTGRAEIHVAALGFSQVIIVVWMITNPSAPGPFVAIVSSLAVAGFGLLWSWLAARLVRERVDAARFHAASAAAVLLSQFVIVVASLTSGAPPAAALSSFHLLAVGGSIGLATAVGWFDLPLLSSVLAGGGALTWQLAHVEDWGGALLVAMPVYVAFLGYPLALGRKVGRLLSPHLAAVVASAWFFVVARTALLAGGYGGVIGLLPVFQAALLGVLLAALLRIEPSSERTLGRLALVAGAVLAFVTLAVPVQLERQWVTVAWALEAAALAWLFRRIPHRGLFWWALGLIVVVFVRLALNPEVLVYQARSDVRIFNWYLYTYLTCAAAMLVAGWMFARTNDSIVAPLRASQLAPAAATILLFLLLNIEIADFFATGETIRFNLSAGLAQNLTYTLGWAAFAVCLLTVGIVTRSHAARVAAIVLLTVTVLKGFLSDVARLGGLYRVMSFVGLAICLSLVALALQRFVLTPKATERLRE